MLKYHPNYQFAFIDSVMQNLLFGIEVNSVIFLKPSVNKVYGKIICQVFQILARSLFKNGFLAILSIARSLVYFPRTKGVLALDYLDDSFGELIRSDIKLKLIRLLIQIFFWIKQNRCSTSSRLNIMNIIFTIDKQGKCIDLTTVDRPFRCPGQDYTATEVEIKIVAI